MMREIGMMMTDQSSKLQHGAYKIHNNNNTYIVSVW